MTRRIIAMVGIFGAGVVGGLAMREEPVCDSEECLDRIAYERCAAMKGTRNNAALRQRSDSELPKVAGVQDWVFLAHCDGAPQPKINIILPETI